jgi:hypothetical protein
MRLTILPDRFVLELDGVAQTFLEGPQTSEAVQRVKRIKKVFAEGFLDRIIEQERDEPTPVQLDDEDLKSLESLVSSVTSEVGRALIGLTVMQASIKMIEPSQNIRLHKGGAGGENFSWQEGVSMRTLDKPYVTPTLRKYGLLSLNADGFMMTRSLAENYPYSKLYKAALRGAKSAWLDIVDRLELGKLQAEPALRALIGLLLNRTAAFEGLASEAISLTDDFCRQSSGSAIRRLLINYVSADDYSARLYEVALHSAFQILDEEGVFEGSLKPLSQMRSANKKHKNVGDIEIEVAPESRVILEAWDAKFGKVDLRDEVEELYEKLKGQPECKIAGFVTDQEPNFTSSLSNRISEIQDALGGDVSIKIMSFHSFVDGYIASKVDIDRLSKNWLRAFVECLAQRRRTQAPIDEPCHDWLRRYVEFIKAYR